MSPKINRYGFQGQQTKLPRLPHKRSPKSPTNQLSMYKTQSTNPYRAVVASYTNGFEYVPASKKIGIHHCSIEFKSDLKPDHDDQIHRRASSIAASSIKEEHQATKSVMSQKPNDDMQVSENRRASAKQHNTRYSRFNRNSSHGGSQRSHSRQSLLKKSQDEIEHNRSQVDNDIDQEQAKRS